MATKTLGDIAEIVKKVTGRTDQSVSINTIYTYVNDFYQQIAGQELRLFENNSFYEFSTVASIDEYSIDLSSIGYSILSKPAYIGGSGYPGYDLDFHIHPSIFYARWPDTQDYTEQRPTDVLWYDNKLVFRAPPDDVYDVKITAYTINAELSDPSDQIQEDYWFRYIAYGAALDLLGDAGEFEKVSQVMPLFERYKAIVNARTYTQMKERVAIRNF